MGQYDAARSLLRQTDPFESLRNTNPDHYLYLESLVGKSHFDGKLLEDKTEKRAKVARDLQQHVKLVAPNRLIQIIGESLKWQTSQNLLDPEAPYNIFFDHVPFTMAQEDQPIQRAFKKIQFPKGSHAEAAAFSSDGKSLCCGTVDGFLEIYNYLTGKLRKDLSFQAQESMMLIESAVLSVSYSNDSGFIVAGGQDGSINIFNAMTGDLTRMISNAHGQGVSYCQFSKDDSQILSTSFDYSIKIHGLKSGKCLKSFRGHSSFVNQACFSEDESIILTASSDGTVKVWHN